LGHASSVLSARSLRLELVRLTALVAALAVITGAWLAGQRYFYCGPMQRIALDECCGAGAHGTTHAEHDEDAHAAPTLHETPRKCCHARTFDAGDRGTATAAPVVLPAALLAVVAILDLPGAADEPAKAAATHDSRAGPPRAGPLSWRTEIDVSLS
jgi:hypothetical protein